MSKLYFALQPDSDASDEITEIARAIAFEYDLAGPYTPEWLHLSLNGVGHFSLDLVDRAIAVGDGIWAPPVEVTLSDITPFGGDPTPLVLIANKTPALEGLCDVLARAMKQNGLPCAYSSQPHVTFLKDNRVPKQVALARPIRWIAEEFVLIHRDSSLFEVVASWRLRR